MTAVIETLDEVLDISLAKFCGECGEPLSPPGSQCGECGALPRETRQEAAERLAAEPDPVASAEAARLRAEARESMAEAERKLRAADFAEHGSALARERDAARDRVAAALAAHEGKLAVLAATARAEEEAAGPLADAYACYQEAEKNEEEARRLRKGAEAETDAAVRLDAAARVFDRYRDAGRAAGAARESAEAEAGEAAAALAGSEAGLARAEAVLAACTAGPLSGDTVRALARPLLQMAFGSDGDGRQLSGDERAMLGVIGQALQGAALGEYAGALARAEEDRVRARMQDEFLQRPRLTPVGDGRLSAAWAIPPEPGQRR